MNIHKLKYDPPLARVPIYIPLFPHQHLLHQPNPERILFTEFQKIIHEHL